MTLALDRQGHHRHREPQANPASSGAMMPLPEGAWGMPKEMLMALPGYGGDVGRTASRGAQDHGGPGLWPRQALKVKVSTRDFQAFKDPAVLLVDQLNQIYFDAELEFIESGGLVQPLDQAGLRCRPQPHRRRHRRS